jgi:DNA polymerase-1
MSLYAGIDIPGCPDLDNVRKLDLAIIPFLRRAKRLGIAIDRDHFPRLKSEFCAEISTLERDISSYIPVERLAEFSTRSAEIEEESGGIEFNASSAVQIGKLLFDMLGVGKDKPLKRTKGGTSLSTGKKQLELVKADHPIVPLVLRHRELKKLVTTYCTLPELARFHPRGECCPVCELRHDSDQWRIHGEMGTTRAQTWRINHKSPNLGNIPTRTEDGQKVQAGFIAPPGMKLVIWDMSQIELRGLAHLSNCKSMIQVYLDGGDLHDDTCHRALGVPWDVKPDKIKHRMAAKRVNFGIQNGTTEKGLYMQLVMDFGTNKIPIPKWLTETWCKQFIIDWLESRPEVVEYFQLQWFRARRYGRVWNPFGFCRLVPEVRSVHSWIRDAGLRQAQNLPVTSTAAGQLKLSMVKSNDLLQRMYDDSNWCWPLLTIHDAIMVEAAEEIAEEVGEVIGVSMNTCMTDEDSREHRFRVPIESDGQVVDRWEK